MIGADISMRAMINNGYYRLINCDINNLPFKKNTFSAVLSMDILQHEGVNLCMAEDAVQRILKPGGYWLINVPALPGLFSYHDIAVGNELRFSKYEIDRLTKRNFRIYFKSYWNTFALPFVAIRRKITNSIFGVKMESDLIQINGVWNMILYSFLQLEYIFIKRKPLPIGLSLFYILRRKSNEQE